MLNFVYNFLSFLLVFLVKSHTLFESGPHALLWLDYWLLLLFLFRFTALLFILVEELLGIFSDKTLIISIVLLLLRLSLRLNARC